VDAVILAGGRGQRVAGITKLFHKPLLEIEGEPLLLRAVRQARSLGVEVPVVVTSPAIATLVAQVLGDVPANLIIQREPLGPGDALRVGLQVRNRSVGSYRVLVLLSDNYTSDADLTAVCSHEVAVGVHTTPRTEAQRFTWYDPDRGAWIEKKTIPDGSPVECWVGPFVGWRSKMERVMSRVCETRKFNGGEALIGPYLGEMTNETRTVRVEVSSIDVGTVESYRAVKERVGDSSIAVGRSR